MSTSYNSGVILGVKLSEIGFNAKLNANKYEVHDRKGKPTGKFDTDYTWTLNFQSNETEYNHRSLYSDVIEDIINIEMPLELFDNNSSYQDDTNFDKFIIGIEIAERDYDDYNCLNEFDPNKKLDIVKSEIKNQFNVDVEPKLYFYFNVS